jgi:hypothetical protein
LRWQPPVGDIAAEDRGDVDQAAVSAVDQVGLAIGEEPEFREIKHQQRTHAVVGEALPHLGIEQHEQAARMADHFAAAPHRDQAADGQEREQRQRAERPDPVTLGPRRHCFHRCPAFVLPAPPGTKPVAYRPFAPGKAKSAPDPPVPCESPRAGGGSALRPAGAVPRGEGRQGIAAKSLLQQAAIDAHRDCMKRAILANQQVSQTPPARMDIWQ